MIHTYGSGLTFDGQHVGQEKISSGLFVVQLDCILQQRDGITHATGYVQESGQISQDYIEVLRWSLGQCVLVTLQAVLRMAPDSPVRSGKEVSYPFWNRRDLLKSCVDPGAPLVKTLHWRVCTVIKIARFTSSKNILHF